VTSQEDRPGPRHVQDDEAVAARSIRTDVHQELDHAKAVFHDLLRDAGRTDLRRRSHGTRWTNQQLLFHMLFGYLIVLRLLPLVRLFGRLPDPASRVFAALLNAARVPFHVVNFAGSWGGGTILGPRLQLELMDRTLRHLHHRIDTERAADLFLHMHFPVGWDPFFRDTMTVADVYHFGTQHFDFHRAQLSLG
jgi:DinB superfamily